MGNTVKINDFLENEIIDLHDEMALIDPTDTPLTSMLMTREGGVVPAGDIVVMWREKRLNSETDCLKVEGAGAGKALSSSRTTMENYCQILEKVAEVSKTAITVGEANGEDVFSDELFDRLLELKRDMEWYFFNGVKTSEKEETPRQMNGLLNLVNSSNVIDASGGFSEEMLLDGMEKLWDHGFSGNAVYAFVSPDVKRYVINESLKKEAIIPVEQGLNQSIGITVEKYVTDFGTVHFVMSRHIDKNTILLVNMDNVQIAELRGTHYSDVILTDAEGELKDSEAGHFINESSIKLLSSFAAVKFINIPI